jgi:alcohol dehydrogenase
MSHASMPTDPEALPCFDHQPRTRVVFGADSIERAGELARELGAKKILLVTDPGIVAAGHADHLRENLEDAGLKVTTFDRARENPTTRCVASCLSVARRARPDTIVGLGGGSAMDTAKGCNFLLTNGGRMQDYQGVGKARKPMLPFIAIPTTAGTGSECQSAALIVDERTHQKMACLDPKVAAKIAILDPKLTLSQPLRVTACAGMDAIAHALETAVTTRSNPLSRIYSREAFKLCAKAFAEVVTHPNDVEARGRMLLGAALAGLAIENSMLGAAHAAANPLTAHFGIVHGQAVGLMMPHVVRFNSRQRQSSKVYSELAVLAGLTSSGHDHGAENLVARLEALLDLAHLPRRLTGSRANRNMIPLLAEEAARQWTATFNPRPVSSRDFVGLYEAAFAVEGRTNDE